VNSARIFLVFRYPFSRPRYVRKLEEHNLGAEILGTVTKRRGIYLVGRSRRRWRMQWPKESPYPPSLEEMFYVQEKARTHKLVSLEFPDELSKLRKRSLPSFTSARIF
jgi:hypothetical protein